MMLLTPDDLSKMLGVTRKHVIDIYIKQPGFPQSVSGWRKPRWLGDEVKKFLKRKSSSVKTNA